MVEIIEFKEIIELKYKILSLHSCPCKNNSSLHFVRLKLIEAFISVLGEIIEFKLSNLQTI